MKVEWTVEDIKCGRVIGNPKRAERWIIGWLSSAPEGAPRYLLTSLSDGMTIGPFMADELVAQINSNEDMPVEIFERPKSEGRQLAL